MKDTEKGQVRSVYLRTSLGEETFARLKAWAERNTSGNVAEAARRLIALALDGEGGDGGTLEGRLSEMEERVALVCSRGTKASLATLALAATLLVPLCTAERFGLEELCLLLEPQDRAKAREADCSCARVEGLMDKHPAEAFAWAWGIGGIPQRQQGGLDYAKATEKLPIPGIGK